VGGALVILPEGLLVAGKLDPSHDADAVAAFLAHAYRQVSRSASEAKVGNVTRIEFWANDVPWIIFGLDGALLAVFGSGSGNLPAAELAGFATELGKKRGA
jgi:predicted regulator of Ras-like GTPase activity (Roadblock/LC7/MglB family)